MKKIFSVIALSVALGLSTMSFTPAAGAGDDCETTADLSVTGTLDNDDIGDGELSGKIINQSRSRDYEQVMVRVDFIGDKLSDNDLISDDSRRDMDVDVDVDDMDVDIDAESNHNATMSNDNSLSDEDLSIESDIDRSHSGSLSDNGSSSSSNVIGSQVFTIHEDVEAGETEDFHLNITPPAGTTSVQYSIVCADND